MNDKFVRIIYLIFMLVFLVGGSGAWWVYASFMQPGPLSGETNVIIHRGSGFSDIASELADSGVIDDSLSFRLGAQFLGADNVLRAGEYAFPAKVSPREALKLLQSGRTVIRRLTIAEGLTTTQILQQLQVTEGLEGDVTGADVDMSQYKEGTLLPETYHFSYGDSRISFLARLTGAMSQQLDSLWRNRAYDLPFQSPEEALVLASIIEKETARSGERARVAGVFINRLKKGMRLQSDPTVSYGLTLGKAALGRPLSRADLKKPTPYNTYVIPGLPPGPISNPGRESLVAALHPEKTEDLYFVADGKGGHVFARTLKEHNKNVSNWRKLNKKKSAEK